MDITPYQETKLIHKDETMIIHEYGEERQDSNIAVIIKKDMILETNEIFCANLSVSDDSGTAAARSPYTANITIIDDPHTCKS